MRALSLPRWAIALYLLLFAALPIGVITWAWAAAAVNVPKWDDHILKYYLTFLSKEPTLIGDLKLLFKQHNEHRIAYDRLLTWIDYSLFGKLSFLRLMVYGNLSLLGLVALFAWLLAKYTKNWYLFLPPVVLLLVSLSQWENLYWAMSAMQNFSVVCWVLWSLYALTHRQNPALAISLAAVATFVSGNGLLIWPVGAVVLLAQRRYQLLPYWLCTALLLIVAYFWTYDQPSTHPPTRGTVPELITGFLAFLGAAVDALPIAQTYWPAMLAGGLLIGFWLYCLIRLLPLIRRGEALTALDSFMLGSVAFVVGTAIIVVWGRYGYGRDTLLTSRYRIYSLTLLALSYVYCLSTIYKKQPVWVLAAFLLASIGLWWSAFVVNTHESVSLRRYLLTSQYNWTYTTNSPQSSIDAATRKIVDSAPAFYDRLVPAFFKPLPGPNFPIDSVYKSAANYHILVHPPKEDAGLHPSLNNPDAGYTLLLRSAKRTYLYGALPQPRRHWRVVLGLLPRYSDQNVIDLAIAETELEAGTYEIGVIRCGHHSAENAVFATDQLLTVAPHAVATGPEKNW